MIGWCFKTSRGLAEIALDQSLPIAKVQCSLLLLWGVWMKV
jgi:hypothetical protein